MFSLLGATKCGGKLQALPGELSLEILQSLKDGFLYNSNRWQDTDSFASLHFKPQDFSFLLAQQRCRNPELQRGD